ncbi:MAG: hypothetical protein PHW82_13620, partial [Bacteroidales bacterium]|nr:hypothetical protein [Bacteroidales bacterium]
MNKRTEEHSNNRTEEQEMVYQFITSCSLCSSLVYLVVKKTTRDTKNSQRALRLFKKEEETSN